MYNVSLRFDRFLQKSRYTIQDCDSMTIYKVYLPDKTKRVSIVICLLTFRMIFVFVGHLLKIQTLSILSLYIFLVHKFLFFLLTSIHLLSMWNAQ